VPLSLASLRGVRCGACGFEGPPRADVLDRLWAAQHELSRLDVRARQLDGDARAAVGRALRARVWAFVALGVGALPFVALSVVGVQMGIEHDGPIANRVSGVFFICVPSLVYATVALALLAVVGHARRRLLAVSAAIPPARPGDPAACAVCGAPLLAGGLEPIARCDYCGADNVVHPAALAQASAARAIDLGAITSTLRQRAEEAVAMARRARAASVALVVGTPFAGFFAVLAMLLLALVVEPLIALAPSPRERYAWVKTKRGACVGHMTRDGDRTRAYFGSNDRLPNPMTVEEELPRFAGPAVIGRRVRLAGGAVGRVREVLGAPVTNREQAVLDGGERGDLAGACAAP